jgi:nicotinate-nucleotide pyrophosphorylase (carboxylating)
MNDFFNPPIVSVNDAVKKALEEDFGLLGDLSSDLLSSDIKAQGCFIARESGVLAGTLCVLKAAEYVDTDLKVDFKKVDGETVNAGEQFGLIIGTLQSILSVERVALNFLGLLSGIASITNKYVQICKEVNPNISIVDTRKTLPGLRALSKAAVRAGGGKNHRGNLSDGILIKDNHLALMSMEELITKARRMWPYKMVEVECETFNQVKQAIELNADIIMLDNMEVELAKKCVDFIRDQSLNTLIEISGGINLENVALYAQLGPDFISIGSLTHSVKTLDISLEITPDASCS